MVFFTLVARSPTPQPFTEFKNLMKTYAKAVLVAGVIIPILLHMVAGESMPWWPDTVSMGIAFGAAAFVVVWKTRIERETNRRLWNALKILGRRWTSS